MLKNLSKKWLIVATVGLIAVMAALSILTIKVYAGEFNDYLYSANLPAMENGYRIVEINGHSSPEIENKTAIFNDSNNKDELGKYLNKDDRVRIVVNGTENDEVQDFVFSGTKLLIQTEITMKNDPCAARNVSNGNYIGDILGFNRQDLIDWLNGHGDIGWYQGTQYLPGVSVPGNEQPKSPNFDPGAWGTKWTGTDPGMNCTGFVWHALCGGQQQNHGSVNVYSVPNNSWDDYCAGFWRQWIENNAINEADFDNSDAMISSGILEKGDVIWACENGDIGSWNSHILIYWGEDSSGQNIFWHSPESGNQISGFATKVPCSLFRVLKTGLRNGGITMDKTSSCDWSLNNPNYSFEGCVYHVFKDEACTQNTGVDITLNKKGHGETSKTALPKGTYYLKESGSRHGVNYLVNQNCIGKCNVEPNQLNSVKWAYKDQGETSYTHSKALNTPIDDPAPVAVRKADAQTREAGIPEGDAKLADAHYEYAYYTDYFTKKSEIASHSSSYQKHWIMKTNDDGETGLSTGYIEQGLFVSGDDFYYRSDGKIANPLGSYVVHEVQAPEGYELSDKTYIVQVIPNTEHPDWGAINIIYDADTGERISYIEEENYFKGFEQVKKNDVELEKKNEVDVHMAGIPFKVTSKTTGEWHILVTDENGWINTQSKNTPHLQNTNGNDVAYNPTTGLIDESKLIGRCGYWFCWDTEKDIYIPPTEADEGLGTFYFDTYTIEELRVSGNEGYELWSDEFVVDHTTTDIPVDIGTVVNHLEDQPWISTLAFSVNGDKELDITENEKIIDTVYYHNLEAGEEYCAVATLVEKSTGAVIVDDADNCYTNFIASVDGSGEVDVALDGISTYDLAGKELVVYEKVYEGWKNDGNALGELVCKHTEIGDVKQMVSVKVPVVQTNLEFEDGTKVVPVCGNATLVDYVNYAGLKPNRTYTLKGSIVDKATGRVFATNEVDFKAKSDANWTSIEFNLSTIEMLEGTNLVAFEQVFYNDELIAAHEDLMDGAQTVVVKAPTLTTYLHNEDSHSQIVKRSYNTVLLDTVTYRDVAPGEAYTLKASLVNKATEQIFVDCSGKKAETTVEFTPVSKSGTVDVFFECDTSSLPDDMKIVAFEKLYIGERNVANHTDLTDLNQTVTIDVPVIALETMATNTAGGKDVEVKEEVGVVDRVTYSNVETGFKYTLKGKLYDKATGEPLKDGEGKEISSEVEFTPIAAAGYKDVYYYFNTVSLGGKDVVVFEELYDKDNNLVAQHKDLLDVYQTVHVKNPQVRTTLLTVDGSKDLYQNKTAHLVDYIDYVEFSTDIDYEIKGQIVEKSTGNIVAEKSKYFNPTSTAGEEKIEFIFDTTGYINEEYFVAYESVYLAGTENLVCEHKDISDSEQTVHFIAPQIKTFLHANESTSQSILREYNSVIVDSVSYTGLAVGIEYRLEGALMDGKTGDVVIDCSGKEVRAEVAFTPTAKDGIVDVIYECDTSAMPDDASMVAFEKLYLGDVNVASHEDLLDAGQTVVIFVPTMTIETVARGAESNNSNLYCIQDEKIVDLVKYSDVEPGYTYKLVATLMYKSTGLPVYDESGKAISVEHYFLTEGKTGQTEVIIPVDTRALGDEELVVYEKMYDHTGVLRAAHEDIQDFYQTVRVLPYSIKTELVESISGNHDIQRYADQILYDVISYENLCPYRTYKIDGVLMDKGKKDVYKNEVTKDKVVGSVEFVPTESKGSVNVVYAFDSTLMAEDVELVSFVDVFVANKEKTVYNDLCQIHDLEDLAETVKIVTPEISTEATYIDGNKYFIASKDSEAQDKLIWEGLPVGKSVDVYSWFAYNDSGLPVTDGTLDGIEAQDKLWYLVDALGGRITQVNPEEEGSESFIEQWLVKFFKLTNKVNTEKMKEVDWDALSHLMLTKQTITPGAESGEDIIKFNFDSSRTMAGNIVCYTVLVSDNTVVAHKTDIDDENETMEVLRSFVETELTTERGEKFVEPETTALLIDKVNYYTVIPGKKYQLQGQIVDKSTNQVLATNALEFKPEESEGSVELGMEVDTTGLGGHDIVAFETLYLDGTIACEHCDINDANQTVHINATPPAAQTGDTAFWVNLLAVLALIGAVGYEIYRRNRRSRMVGKHIC